MLQRILQLGWLAGAVGIDERHEGRQPGVALQHASQHRVGSGGITTSSGQSSTSRPLSRVLIGSPSRRFEVLEPSVVAHSLMAAHRVLVELVRSLAVGGVAPEEIAARAARRADSAFAVISDGIAGYGRR